MSSPHSSGCSRPRRRLSQIARVAAAFAKDGHPKFPWRSRCTPYRVLVAEFCLQRTDAGQATEAFESFLSRYPTLRDAARADSSAFVDLFRSLGLHHRAGTLAKCISYVVGECGGKFPKDERGLLLLPGVGRYIARAILCFAEGQAVGVVDVNVARVLVRAVMGGNSIPPRPGTVKELWELSDSLALVAEDPRMTQWGLLDIGREICQRVPRCPSCPVARICLYRATLRSV